MTKQAENKNDYFNAAVVLADGKVFYGRSFGYQAAGQVVVAEVVFNTAMYGYQEILTDPSYRGQAVIFSTAEIGNVGFNQLDWESDELQASAVICKNYNDAPSNYRSDQTLAQALTEHQIPGIEQVDTRALIQYIRTHGAQVGAIVTDVLSFDLEELKTLASDSTAGLLSKDFVSVVTCGKKYQWKKQIWDQASNAYPEQTDSADLLKLVVIDLGVKHNILRLLATYGFDVEVLPATATAEEIAQLKPDALFISNGPGDPSNQTHAIELVRTHAGKLPIFGICLGHQIIGHALGATTSKLKFGHRGGNHPVRDLATRRVEITTQNHGYTVDLDQSVISELGSFVNLNDLTNEGITSPQQMLFSVQHHPESSPGPHDSQYLFGEFYQLAKDQQSKQTETTKE